MGRLPSHADRVRFAAICRSRRAAARHQQSPPQLPWLALPDGTFFSFPGSSAFRLPGAAHYHGSCDDWLVFERGDDEDGGGYKLLFFELKQEHCNAFNKEASGGFTES
ncbi:putative F-box protein [Panicum miliaceum]|uniref:F-box protein n=1 Tax=Panicum miliaceum TaxID=4540 RepID=A0A3L6RM28_PANMI|nr:putative F-box protein [Panicum miliaceum]